jgi:hypothetical protein
MKINQGNKYGESGKKMAKIVVPIHSTPQMSIAVAWTRIRISGLSFKSNWMIMTTPG